MARREGLLDSPDEVCQPSASEGVEWMLIDKGDGFVVVAAELKRRLQITIDTPIGRAKAAALVTNYYLIRNVTKQASFEAS
jgi:hypothetical protein